MKITGIRPSIHLPHLKGQQIMDLTRFGMEINFDHSSEVKCGAYGAVETIILANANSYCALYLAMFCGIFCKLQKFNALP